MVDLPLSPEDQKEAFSLAYVSAVVAQVRYGISEPKWDRLGWDLTVEAGGEFLPAIKLQLKATSKLKKPRKGVYKFRLKRRNYDILRAESQTPQYLVVLDMPEDETQWTTITDTELILRRRALWEDLKGYPECEAEKPTISIREKNLFNPDSLRDLMEKSRLEARRFHESSLQRQ